MNIQPITESEQAIVDEEHPWPGLASFREQDTHFFKGRQSDIEKLHSLVNRERLTVLFGISGLGKSSLLQAGLFPLLRQDNLLPVTIRLDFAEGAAGLSEQVFAAIDRQVQEKSIEAPTHHENETLWEYFHRKDAEFWDQRNRMVVPLLCFDQFEEIFTLGRENQERVNELNAFIKELADLVEGRCPESVKTRLEVNPDEAKNFSFSRHPYKLIFSLREDYLADLEGLRTTIPSIIHNRFRLLPLNGEQALSVVNQTEGRLMTSKVAQEIVQLVGGKQHDLEAVLSSIGIEPALLSLICRELNERRIADNARQFDAKAVASNRDQILQNFYDRSLENHSIELRHFIEDKLLTVSGFRNSEAYDNALSISGINKQALDDLVQHRLLRLEERDGNKRIELIHDVLTGVVRKSREQRQLREKQQQAEQERLEAQQKEQTAREEMQRSKRRTMVFASLTFLCFMLTVYSVLSGYYANKATEEAWEANKKAQHAVAVADFREAQRHYENKDYPNTLVNLAQSIRSDPSWISSRTLLVNLLQQKIWVLPRSSFKHEGTVWSAAFSADGSRVVTASSDSTARLWDAHSGKPLGESMAHEGRVRSAAFSADGSRVVTASDDKTARLWDAHSGKPLGEFMAHEGTVMSAAFSSDGSRVVTASYDNTARLWDAHSGKPLGESMAHEGTVRSATFSADGSRVVTASEDNTARLWDAHSGKPLGESMAHETQLSSAAFSADGSRVVTASSDKTAHLWDAHSGKPLGESMAHEGTVRFVAFSSDGSRVVTASEDNTARLWDAHSGKPLGEPMIHESWVRSAEFSADGSRVVTASDDNTARLWDAHSGKPLGEPMAHEGRVLSAAFSADGSRVVTASDDNTARLWDAHSGKSLDESMAHEDRVLSAAFSADGSRVVTASEDNTARLWDAHSGKPLGESMAHEGTVMSAAFSSDGSRVVTASYDKTAHLWDAHSGKPLGEPMAHEGTVWSAAFSADGSRVVTASSDTARLWDAHSGKPLGESMAHEGTVWSAAFSADGSRVVTASEDNTARLWDARSGRPLGEPMAHEGTVWSAAFSADGSRVVTASADNTARLWGAHSGKPLGESIAHESTVRSAAFSADGSRVVTASEDNTARLWDAHSGKPLGEPMIHESWVRSAEFSADGSRVVTASYDNTAGLWDAHSGKPLGEPMAHEGTVWSATFSADGSRVVTASSDNTARLWDVSPVLGDPHALLPELAEAVTGLKLGDYGAIEILDDHSERLNQLRERTRNAPLGETTAESFTRWFLSDPWTRTISPLSQTTVPEYIQQQLSAGRREQVLQEFPGHPLLRPAASSDQSLLQ